MSRLRLLTALLGSLSWTACTGGRSTPAPRPSTGGDPAHGAQLIHSVGCGACHLIPGVRGARGVVGPPLTGFAQRTFIGGEVPNTPENLVTWIMNPHTIEPRTAMPALGLGRDDARDIGAYLYTLQ